MAIAAKKVLALVSIFLYLLLRSQGCVRGQHGRGQGQVNRHIRSRPCMPINPTWPVKLYGWFLEELYISTFLYWIASKVLPKQTNSVEHWNILLIHCALLVYTH